MHADIAAVMGFDDLYTNSEPFRERFNEMLDAVKALPEVLQVREGHFGIRNCTTLA